MSNIFGCKYQLYNQLEQPTCTLLLAIIAASWYEARREKSHYLYLRAGLININYLSGAVTIAIKLSYGEHKL